jgi:hypothetical protein
MEALPHDGSLVAFALELHTAEPERLVQFYESTLGVKFAETTYPFRRYATELGRLALIISDARGHDVHTASAPGSVTLSVLTPGRQAAAAPRYFLHPHRPLAATIPGRHGARFTDPDGNHVALVAPMDEVLGRMPPIASWRALADAVREFALARTELLGRRAFNPIERLLDRYEYVTGRVTYLRRDLRPYTHIVTSREGLFAINETSYARILRGGFFGLTVKDGAIYCFQSCEYDENPAHGRLLRLIVDDGQITSVQVLATGLDRGCHQIDFVGDDLLLVDCYNASIVKMQPDSGASQTYYPLGRMSRHEARESCHMNSVAAHPDGTVWVLLHNSHKKPSEVLVLNAEFEIVRRFDVDAGAAHNIVFTNDELEYLIADSRGGRIVSARGTVIDGGSMLFRGISLTPTACVIGESCYSTRVFRRFVPGYVHFFDRRSWSRQHTLHLPAAPADIRRIDGQDLSISNHLFAQVRAARATAARASVHDHSARSAMTGSAFVARRAGR